MMHCVHCVWRTQMRPCLLYTSYLTNAEVLVLYDTYAAVYDTADGTELYRYSYGGRTLPSAAISAGKNAVLLFGDGVQDVYKRQPVHCIPV